MRVVTALGIAAIVLAGCAGSDSGTAAVGGEDVSGEGSSMCRRDATFRADFRELDAVTGEEYTSLRHEVDGDRVRIEPSSTADALLLTESGNWQLTDGTWSETPGGVRPVRPLRTPWMNNFVTGSGIERATSPVGDTTVAGIVATVYEPTMTELEAAVPERFREREFDPSRSTFRYVVDRCGDVIAGDVALAFAGDEATFLDESGISDVLLYRYVTYDTGAAMPHLDERPTGLLPPIPPPPAS